jgi:hypothetical protein
MARADDTKTMADSAKEVRELRLPQILNSVATRVRADFDATAAIEHRGQRAVLARPRSSRSTSQNT